MKAHGPSSTIQTRQRRHEDEENEEKTVFESAASYLMAGVCSS